MAFENLTVLEFHLHTGDTDEGTSIRRRVREPSTTAASDESSGGRSKPLLALLMLVVSVALSIGVTVAVRRFTGGDEE
ncbi:MAG: hypothetical protein ABEJ67_02400 [Halanaeroarchaeum sp.]